MAARSDDKILFAIHAVGHRRCVAACRKLSLPEFFSGLDIEGANVRVKRTGDKRQTAGGEDRTAKPNRNGSICQRGQSLVVSESGEMLRVPERNPDKNPLFKRVSGRLLEASPEQFARLSVDPFLSAQ